MPLNKLLKEYSGDKKPLSYKTFINNPDNYISENYFIKWNKGKQTYTGTIKYKYNHSRYPETIFIKEGNTSCKFNQVVEIYKYFIVK